MCLSCEDKGNARLSFFSNTMPSVADCRVTEAWAFMSGLLLYLYPLKRGVLTTSSRMRRTLRSTTASSSVPFFTPSMMWAACSLVPGSSMSLPAIIWAAPSAPPHQSVMTVPLYPHSSRRMVVSSSGLSEVYTSLMRLYELMMVQGWLSFTTISKAFR